jgi:HAD superfamily 5'-nucleotidase-like hydrolase
MPSIPELSEGGTARVTGADGQIPERVMALLEALARPTEIPRACRVYANRNLDLDRVRLVGFDMDYTLALYDQPRMEGLSVKATVDKLVKVVGYPEAIRHLDYDHRLGIRGLVVDRQTGNILKPDRYGAPGRAYHGRQPIDRGLLRELYQRQRTRLSSDRYAFIDTLFALPEAVLFADLVDFFDGRPAPKPEYARIWDDIRHCIDLAHRDGSIKDVIAADMTTYIERDPHLAEALHKMRSSGKQLFLLTNSAWDYTNPVMKYMLDGVLDAYPSWRNYFDIVVVSAQKPSFFTDRRPFEEVDNEGRVIGTMLTGAFQRHKVYSGGNIFDFEERVEARGDRVLFVGDHIYGDMLRSRKSTAWRTAMVIQELEHEVAVHDRLNDALERLEQMDRQLRQQDGDIEEKQHILRTLQKMSGGKDVPVGILEAKKKAKELVDRLRTELRATMSEHAALEQKADAAFNPYWGPLLHEGREVSKFGDQVEDYACLYTSRVSNFRFYSPMRHFRGPRDRMPHER